MLDGFLGVGLVCPQIVICLLIVKIHLEIADLQIKFSIKIHEEYIFCKSGLATVNRREVRKCICIKDRSRTQTK